MLVLVLVVMMLVVMVLVVVVVVVVMVIKNRLFFICPIKGNLFHLFPFHSKPEKVYIVSITH